MSNDNDITKLIDKNWTSIIVHTLVFTNMNKELILNFYLHIQFIHIQSCSFSKNSYLTISNLPKLKFLTVEYDSFDRTRSLTLESIF